MNAKLLPPVALIASLLCAVPDSEGALAALWRFDNIGGSQPDATGNANTATTMNGAAWVQDLTRNSGAMNYDGSNDFLQAADSASLSITGDMTISLWVNLTTLASANQWRGLVNKDPSGSNAVAPYQFWFNQPNSLAAFGRGNGTLSDFAFGAATAGNIPVAGSWEHWAVSMSGTTATMYRNGVAIAMTDTLVSTTIADGNGPLIIGDRPGAQDMSFHGRMDDVSIFNEALTQTQIQTIMGGDFSDFGVVPEPGTALFGLAVCGAAAIRRRRR